MTTRGDGEQEVDGGALHGGGRGKGLHHRQKQSRGAEGAQRKKIRGENVQGLMCKTKKI
jgi:hypothetical protein